MGRHALRKSRGCTRLGIRADAGRYARQFFIGPKNWPELTEEHNEGDRPRRINGGPCMGYADRAKTIVSMLLAILIAGAGGCVTMANAG